MNNEGQKLLRSRTNRILFGVCGGLADYFHFDATIIRIIFILLAFNGFGVLVYLIMALVMPLEPAPGQASESAREAGGQSGQTAESASGEPISGEPQFREEKFREFAQEVGNKARGLAEEFKASRRWENTGADESRNSLRNVFGLIIILVGVMLLLRQFFPFAFGWFGWGMIWPLLIIFLGLVLLIKRK